MQLKGWVRSPVQRESQRVGNKRLRDCILDAQQKVTDERTRESASGRGDTRLTEIREPPPRMYTGPCPESGTRYRKEKKKWNRDGKSWLGRHVPREKRYLDRDLESR